MKLESLIAKRLGVGARQARLLLREGRVKVGSGVERDFRRTVTRFDSIDCDGATVQSGLERLRILLHKPAGILSATSDPVHRTVLDLVDHPDRGTLHLAGRLDRSSTGLVLLTNDGRWSASLTDPAGGIEKVYLVGTDRPVPEEAVTRFAEGFWFATEGLTTLPARLEILSPQLVRVSLREGRYHQIKRMFHRLNGIRLTSLHRVRIGPYELPDDLAPGQWRRLDLRESVANPSPGID